MREFSNVQIENLTIVLTRINNDMKKYGLDLSYGAEQFYAGDITQILGLMWVFISEFEIFIK